MKTQENNFKAVLESIRDLMNEETVLPDWLHDIFLGYGDPAAAQYTHMDPSVLLQTLDFKVRGPSSVSWPVHSGSFFSRCVTSMQLSSDLVIHILYV
jgi:hypothetical protein